MEKTQTQEKEDDSFVEQNPDKKKQKAEFHLSPLQIPHYSLTVQAADEGDPPLSSAVLITITVTDVNDNPPVFSQVNHSLLLQV